MATKAKQVMHVDDHPKVKPELAKLDKLKAENRELLKRLSELDQAAFLGKNDPQFQERAERLLGGEEVATFETVEQAAHDANDRLGVVRAAIRIQHDKVESLRTEVATELLKPEQPRYAELARNVADSLDRLIADIEAEQAFCSECSARGISPAGIALPEVNMVKMLLGGTRRHGTALATLQRAIERRGY